MEQLLAPSPKKTPTANKVGMRPARPADGEFVFSVTERTLRSHVEKTWGRWDADSVRASFCDRTHSIVQLDGADIGCVKWIEEETQFYLSKLYILPDHQNRGIGTRLLEEFRSIARAAHKKIALRVLGVNRAKNLYLRLGFRVQHETPERLMTELDTDNRAGSAT